MPKKRFSAEQIVTLLRQIEVSMAQGKSTPEACRAAEISAAELLPLAQGIRRAGDRSGKAHEGPGARECSP